MSPMPRPAHQQLLQKQAAAAGALRQQRISMGQY